MKTEQIVSYLFLSTTIVVFAILILYAMQTAVGNGGEYWGMDGRTHPRSAAVTAWESGDYRFLDIGLEPHEENLTVAVPGVGVCANHPMGNDIRYRRSSDTPLHAADSLKLATIFAWDYNYALAQHLNWKNDAGCELIWRSYYGFGPVPTRWD